MRKFIVGTLGLLLAGCSGGFGVSQTASLADVPMTQQANVGATSNPTPTPSPTHVQQGSVPTATPALTPHSMPGSPLPIPTPLPTTAPTASTTPAPTPTAGLGADEICSGVHVDLSGQTSAASAIQACLDRAGSGQTLELPAGTYLVDQMITIGNSGITLTTRGMNGSATACGDGAVTCAVLKASPSLATEAILKTPAGVTALVLDHVNFDGNRFQRLNLAAQLCSNGQGRNVIITDATNVSVRASGFYRALCGTSFGAALSTFSASFQVESSTFADNGDHSQYWSDGLTIGFVTDSSIINNTFTNNSDVSLILGGGVRTQITGNHFVQNSQGEYAAFMLTNWSVGSAQASQAWADFRGLVVSTNRFDLGDFADIAIQIGVLPWGGASRIAYLRTLGGSITSNTISTNRQGINVAGGGTPDFPTTIANNGIQLIGDRKTGGFLRQVPTSLVNVQNSGSDSFCTGQDITGASSNNWNDAF